MADLKEKFKNLEKFKYPVIILILGIFLMLLPSGSKPDAGDSSVSIQQLLSSTEGVGEARAIISESGAVVVCRGADNAKVRLQIIKAIGSYTGFSSDKITILKMAD